MTLFSALRKKSLPLTRRRRTSVVDYNADLPRNRPTGDPRLDLAQAVTRAGKF